MRISDWSSDVCSSDLRVGAIAGTSLAHCALLIGSVRAGALASPLSTRLSQRETGEFFEQAERRLVFTDADQVPKHSTTAGVGCRALPIARLTALQRPDAPECAADAGPRSSVVINTTNGSTTPPKVGVYTQKQKIT